jgi:hypothetical protein
MSQNRGIAAWLSRLMRSGGPAGGADSDKTQEERELAELRRKVGELERQLREWKEAAQAPIVVEQIRIDRVVVDKIEYQNNFGALGIKELQGKLNIGANYTLSKDELPAEVKEGFDELAMRRGTGFTAAGKSGPAAVPKVNVRGK